MAIDVNTALLALSDALGQPIAHGDLLRLLQLWGLPWGLPVRSTSGPVFPTGFYIAVGLAMAVVYAIVRPWIGLRLVALWDLMLRSAMDRPGRSFWAENAFGSKRLGEW